MNSLRDKYLQQALDVFARYPTLEDAVRTVYRGELGSSEESELRRLLREQLESADRSGPVIASARDAGVQDGTASESRHALFTPLRVVESVESVASGTNVFERKPDVFIE